jgi:succinate dehydrogenase/fumarate reductase flavoprotein subunit
MKTLTTDVLVIGGGAAGLRAAIEARRFKAQVLLVTKTPAGLGNCTAYAGGGFQAPFGRMTSEEHFERTVKGGRFLGNQRLIEVMTHEAAARLLELREFGVDIKTGNGTANVRGPFPMNGTGLTLPLVKFARSSGVLILQNMIVTRLCKGGDGVVGAVGFNRIDGEIVVFQGKSTILASGGAGQIYSRTDTPIGTTGEGYAMAYEAGSRLIDMEFVQFFPFGLAEPGLPMFLFNPGVVEMGRLVNSNDREFLKEAGYSPGRDFIQHRDTLSKLIWTEIYEGRGDGDAVLLDLKKPKETQYSSNMLGTFEEIRRKWLSKVDLTKQLLHIAPLVHYFMGGIEIDENGTTNVPGLYAAGEVTGGVDGANRLGGNALTNTIVFGARAGRSAVEYAESSSHPKLPDSYGKELERHLSELRANAPSAGSRPKEIRKRLQKMMLSNVGVIRTKDGLDGASGFFHELREDLSRMSVDGHWELGEALEVEAMLTVAEIVTRCASERKESRGAHYRLDYSDESSDWLKNIVVQGEGPEIRTYTRDVVTTRLQPK